MRRWLRPRIPGVRWKLLYPAAAGPISRVVRCANVNAPTLLIVGGRDEIVLELNRKAQAVIPGRCDVAVVPGATHLFEEPGTLEELRGWRATGSSITCAMPPQMDRRRSLVGVYAVTGSASGMGHMVSAEAGCQPAIP